MKFFLFVLVFIGFGFRVNAQSFAHGVGIGVHAATAIYLDSFKVKKSTSMRPGFKVYWMGRANLEGNINFAPEIGYTFKGYRVKDPDAQIKEQEVIVHYIDFKFIQEYTILNKYFVKIGPGLSAAIAGTDKQLSSTNLRSNKPLAFNFAAYGRFEGHVSIAVGAHLGAGWIAELTTTRGISNIYDGDDGPNIKHRTYGLSIGKYLRRGKL